MYLKLSPWRLCPDADVTGAGLDAQWLAVLLPRKLVAGLVPALPVRSQVVVAISVALGLGREERLRSCKFPYIKWAHLDQQCSGDGEMPL